MLIDLFIKEKWFTVPLKGVLERLPNGDKTVPEFEANWKEKYTNNFNTHTVKLAGALTGKLSGIIAIDCDNQFTYDLIKSFDPDYDFHFISKGKPEGGGTIIYSYYDGLDTFKFHMETISLDFYSDSGFIYLPTENNKTKESWADRYELPSLKEIPEAVVKLLKAFKHKVIVDPLVKRDPIKHNISNRLAPLLEQFVQRKEYDPVLFKIITPYSFRELASYAAKGHLHPNDVPKGRGSEYLSKISAILGADISVDMELYCNAMMLINSLWDVPMEKGKLNATIINPMVGGKACIEGVPIWNYDEYWRDLGLVATALNGDYIESFFDDVRSEYYLINYTVGYIKTFTEKAQIIKTLKTMTGRSLTEQQYDITKQIIRTEMQPNHEFGHIKGTDQFNLFRQTRELAVLNNPKGYEELYKRPTATLNYLETLIPDDFVRNYTLRFIRTKLTTFKYSPIVLYFIGKSGSGKDTFVSLLGRIVGADYITRPTTKIFLEQYNDWMMDKFFIQLDEYGNKLSRQSDKDEVLGKLKSYTGSPEVQIRAMRTGAFNYRHSVTFIMTANSNPLAVEIEDRRFLFITTPNILPKMDWVIEQGGIAALQAKLAAEILDFCYYLSTEVKNLSDDEYVLPPDTEDKETLILANLPAAQRIVYLITHEKFEELYELALEYNITNFKYNWDKGRLEDDKLKELYEAITESRGDYRTVIRALKGSQVLRQHSTRNGQNYFFYNIGKLKYHAQSEGDFDSVTTTIKPKGL
jgi:hypothetical protein